MVEFLGSFIMLMVGMAIEVIACVSILYKLDIIEFNPRSEWKLGKE